jgi:parallel beta-helix repeat protein
LYYSNNNTLCGNYATGYYFPADMTSGFNLDFSDNNTLIGNDVSGNAQGIILENSDNNTLIANNASWSVSGGPGEAAPWGVDLELDSSSNNTVLDSNFTNSNGPGVTLNSAFNNTLVHNNCVSDSDGIDIGSSSGNVLSDNVIKDNQGYVVYDLVFGGNGITLYASSYTTVSGNTATANAVGIVVADSSNNTIYHNSFIGNSLQVSSDGSPNTWDNGYPSGGNYWSDYNGTDLKSGQYQNVTGSDGIGDTPYVINANNTDHYPLMNLYTSTSFYVAKTVIGQGLSTYMYFAVANYGNDSETLNVTACANTTSITSENVTLTSGKSATIRFSWNTARFAYGTYNLTAYA